MPFNFFSDNPTGSNRSVGQPTDLFERKKITVVITNSVVECIPITIREQQADTIVILPLNGVRSHGQLQ
jgi:hypothetical protein